MRKLWLWAQYGCGAVSRPQRGVPTTGGLVNIGCQSTEELDAVIQRFQGLRSNFYYTEGYPRDLPQMSSDGELYFRIRLLV